MKCLPLAFLFGLTSVGCVPFHSFPSPDCQGTAPAGFTRIFVGRPASKGSHSGISADDPLDGTTADKFDTILRTISQGQFPTWGAQKNIGPENLVVCVMNGTFATNGFSHSFPGDLHSGEQLGSDVGFSVGTKWRIHGQGPGQTTLKLVTYLRQEFATNDGSIVMGGSNTVISNNSFQTFGVEVSDLTLDANHDGMTNDGGTPLNLSAISLRSVKGGNRIHNVEVRGASGDLGFLNIVYESFAIQIWGEPSQPGGFENEDNLIENINVHKPGKAVLSGESAGGKMDGIVVSNASAEVRSNSVENAIIGYGGWLMHGVNFHDNVAQNVGYGFNADSFTNTAVTLRSNQIIHPAFYGIVIGGGQPDNVFSGWTVSDNTIVLGYSRTAGIVLRGHVSNSTFSGNTITADRPVHQALAIFSYEIANGFASPDNAFELNTVDKSLLVDFSQDPSFNSDCRYQNADLQGNPIQSFANNSSSPCTTGP
jgi:hypothetical protein